MPGFRPPIWVGKEPNEVNFNSVLADFESGAVQGEYQSYEEMDEIAARPYLVSSGPVEFSTCQTLEIWPTIIWDSNCYYAHLGVRPKATRAELRNAYQAKQGWKSQRLTYILKQLLNLEVRRAYDATPLGGTFFDDYVAEWVKEQALQDNLKATGRIPTLDDRIEGIAKEKLNLQEFMNKAFDEKGDIDKPPSGMVAWKWGYYMHRSYAHDTVRLAMWQAALLQAKCPKARYLTVGIMGETLQTTRLVKIGYRTVAFISEDTIPTLELAEAVLSSPIELV